MESVLEFGIIFAVNVASSMVASYIMYYLLKNLNAAFQYKASSINNHGELSLTKIAKA